MTSAVIRLRLERWVNPAVVYAVLAAEHPDLVWSDRSAAAEGRVDVIAMPAGPEDVLLCSADGAWRLGDRPLPPAESPFDAVAAALRARIDEARSAHPGQDLAPNLGWWGWFGYELGVSLLGLGPHRDPSPAAALVFAERIVEIDHDAGTVTVAALAGHDEWALRTARRLRRAAGSAVPSSASGHDRDPVLDRSWRHGRTEYLDLIASCQDAIREGDSYLLCLTDRLTLDLGAGQDELELHLRLRSRNAVRHSGIARIAGWTLVSASPEQFLLVDAAGNARTRPIKGTRPRGRTPAVDAALREELIGSEKERAENLMIVDLMRNDLSTISELGSVGVTRLFDVESYPSLHQLVSTVESRLFGDAIDAIGALFPAGSMTGAPKRSSVEILNRLEAGARGIYSGVWGRLGLDGSADLAMVIRSVVLHRDVATIGSGGGITILSDPAAEWDEVELKAAPLLRAITRRSP